jgi:hypothetical protein
MQVEQRHMSVLGHRCKQFNKPLMIIRINSPPEAGKTSTADNLWRSTATAQIHCKLHQRQRYDG